MKHFYNDLKLNFFIIKLLIYIITTDFFFFK
jgi:hypothetical protein